MKPRDFLNFFKTRSGKLVVFAVLFGGGLTVYDLDADRKPVINAQATEAAREKQERIKERFKEWVWSDDSRRERLCRLYNDTFNHTRVRTFNGDHLTLPGASGAIQLHRHQKAGIWRVLQTPNTLACQ